MLLRWRAYPHEHPQHADSYALDLSDPQNGVIFHRVQNNFPPPRPTLSCPDMPILPARREPVIVPKMGSWA